MITLLGIIAAALTSLSYLPQVRKALPRNSTDDLSLAMLCVLLAGLCFWIVYGITIKDWIVILANSVGAALVACVLACKVRDLLSGQQMTHHWKGAPSKPPVRP